MKLFSVAFLFSFQGRSPSPKSEESQRKEKEQEREKEARKETGKETVKEKEEIGQKHDNGISVKLSVQSMQILDLSSAGSSHPNIAWKRSPVSTYDGPLTSRIPTTLEDPMISLSIYIPGTVQMQIPGNVQQTNVHLILNGLRMCFLSRFFEEVFSFFTEGCLEGIKEAIETSYFLYNSIHLEGKDLKKVEGRGGSDKIHDEENNNNNDNNNNNTNNNFFRSSTFRKSESDPSVGTSGSEGSYSRIYHTMKNDHSSNNSSDNHNKYHSGTNSFSSSSQSQPQSPLPSSLPSSPSVSSQFEWKIEFLDTLIIAPRNSWSMDTIAVAVSTGSVEGMYVPTTWSAPKEILQSDNGKFLYFDPATNKWLFEIETPHTNDLKEYEIMKKKSFNPINLSSSITSLPTKNVMNNYTNNNVISDSNDINNDINNDNINNEKKNENCDKILRSKSSLARLFNSEIMEEKILCNVPMNVEEKRERERERGQEIGIGIGIGIGNEVENELEKDISEDSYSDGRTSSKYGSMYSIASSLYKSFDDLDKEDEEEEEERRRRRRRKDKKKKEGEGGDDDDDDDEDEDEVCRSRSGSISQSQKSFLSSYDGNDDDGLFFDAQDYSPIRIDEKKASVRFAIPPAIDKDTKGTDTDVSTDKSIKVKKISQKNMSRVDEKEINLAKIEVKSMIPLVSRIVLTLNQAEVYVSLASPLDPFRVEEAVDELREYSEVSHHAPVYRVARWKEGDARVRDREYVRDRDTESVFVQRYVRYSVSVDLRVIKHSKVLIKKDNVVEYRRGDQIRVDRREVGGRGEERRGVKWRRKENRGGKDGVERKGGEKKGEERKGEERRGMEWRE